MPIRGDCHRDQDTHLPRPPSAAADGGRGRSPEPNELYRATFDDRAAAEENAAALHQYAFLECGPELLGESGETPLTHGPAEATSLPEYALRDFLLDDGIDPPDPVESADPGPHRSPDYSDYEWAVEQRHWASWWGGLSHGRQLEERQRWAEERNRQSWERWWREVVAAGRLTPEQRLRVCEAFNLLRLFEVVESSRVTQPPTAGAVYAIVHTRWVYADTWDLDSHDVAGVFPTRKAAEAELARRRREAAFCAGRQFWWPVLASANRPFGWGEIDVNSDGSDGSDDFLYSCQVPSANHEFLPDARSRGITSRRGWSLGTESGEADLAVCRVVPFDRPAMRSRIRTSRSSRTGPRHENPACHHLWADKSSKFA